MGPTGLSAKAVGLLVMLVKDPTLGSAIKLSEVFTDAKTSTGSGLKELRDAGFVRLGTERIGGRLISYNVVTEAGIDFLNSLLVPGYRLPETRTQIQLSEQLAVVVPTRLTIEPYPGDARGKDESMSPYDFFGPTSSDDEAAEGRAEAERYRQEQRAKLREARDQKRLKKAVTRDDIPRKDWSCRHTGYEIESRIRQRWEWLDWNVSESRFIMALSEMRTRLNTNGDIECQMMDIFFKRIDLQKFPSADIVWRTFLSQANDLYSQVTATMVTEEQQVEDDRLSAKSLEWLEN